MARSHLDPVFLLRAAADLLAHAGPDEQQGGGQRARPRRREPREAAPRVRVQQRERVLVLQRDLLNVAHAGNTTQQ